MVSFIHPGISTAQVQPCDVQARGVTGTQLDILGEQKLEFTLRNKDGYMTFIHTFMVSPLKRCSCGLLGMDFLQQVGAKINLTAQVLYIGHYSFPFRCKEPEVSKFQRLINAGQKIIPFLDQEEREVQSVGDLEGTVELGETVTVPQLSVKLTRYRVVIPNDSAVVKVPRNQVVLVDPEGLPDVYMARIVVKLENCNTLSSSNARGVDRWSGNLHWWYVPMISLSPVATVMR
jgi:hypothetical protein